MEPLSPYSVKETYDLDIAASGRQENFGARFETIIVLPKNANYKFHLGSDDGSRLFVDGEQLIDNDGVHPMSFKTETKQLPAGRTRFAAEYFEKGGEEVLQLDTEGGGLGTLASAP
ncbi:MAG: PA14 domain-containing protein [Pirellulaceae bacterium]